MGLMDVLRRAEEQSKNAARRGKELARATLNESGRTLRRKMRVNPPTSATQVSPAAPEGSEQGAKKSKPLQARIPSAQRKLEAPAAELPRKKIISINGEDVRTEEVTPPARRTA
jgi:hypothetical protein